MLTTIFETPTLFDLRSIEITGMSAKPSTGNPIGRFGSGLKYAIAILLREGAKIKLFCNGDTYTFFLKPTEFRDKTFWQVWYRKENAWFKVWAEKELPYTTEYGKDWEIWQAFRELYANTIDENGACWQSDDSDPMGSSLFSPSELSQSTPARTLICIQHEEFARIFEKRHEIFLDKLHRNVISHSEGIANVSPGKTGHLYFRGMRAYDLPPDKPAQFTYNVIEELDLTEDRTIKNIYEAQMSIEQLVTHSNDVEFIKAVLTAPEESFEHATLNFRHAFGASEAFKEAVRETRHVPHVNKSAGYYYSTYLAPPAPKLIEDKQWAMIVQALEEAGSNADKVIPTQFVGSVSHLYLETMQRKFGR